MGSAVISIYISEPQAHIHTLLKASWRRVVVRFATSSAAPIATCPAPIAFEPTTFVWSIPFSNLTRASSSASSTSSALRFFTPISLRSPASTWLSSSRSPSAVLCAPAATYSAASARARRVKDAKSWKTLRPSWERFSPTTETRVRSARARLRASRLASSPSTSMLVVVEDRSAAVKCHSDSCKRLSPRTLLAGWERDTIQYSPFLLSPSCFQAVRRSRTSFWRTLPCWLSSPPSAEGSLLRMAELSAASTQLASCSEEGSLPALRAAITEEVLSMLNWRSSEVVRKSSS